MKKLFLVVVGFLATVTLAGASEGDGYCSLNSKINDILSRSGIRIQTLGLITESGLGYSRNPMFLAVPKLERGERVLGCAIAKCKRLDAAAIDLVANGGCMAFPFDVTVADCNLDDAQDPVVARFIVRGYGFYVHRYIGFCAIEKP